MPIISASAPGKSILFGEHAVVYGKPAIAVPVHQVRAKAIVEPLIGRKANIIKIEAPDIGVNDWLSELPEEQAFNKIFQIIKTQLNISHFPALKLRISSTIPIASGMGSGAAVSIAAIQAISTFLGTELSKKTINQLAFKVERIHHGTPSGIDNSVICYAQPIFFIKNEELSPLGIGKSFNLMVANSGRPSHTADVISAVRQIKISSPNQFSNLIDQIGDITLQAKSALENGNHQILGKLMTKNHTYLQSLDVSNPFLDKMVNTALDAGALGAKLSGSGRGGNIIVLLDENKIDLITSALRIIGSQEVFLTKISKNI
ncbi:MAG: mevalonate kinase [Anaerolineaceae bacterium]|nr:mevalonate kinase [Anaerolineaceae bacterium]